MKTVSAKLPKLLPPPTNKVKIPALLADLGLSSEKVNSGVFDGRNWGDTQENVRESLNPSTGKVIAKVGWGSKADFERCVKNSFEAREAWARTPAPVRGGVVRNLGNALRAKKKPLGQLLSLEMGKIQQEGEGEIQEFIDVCDMASGLSRVIPTGLVLPSERTGHTIIETYNPLGLIGIITAFNFPHAVFGWNAAISLVCGNTQIIKGAESASLITIATQRILAETLDKCGVDPRVATLCQGAGNNGPGEWMSKDERVSLVSFTGSTNAGRKVSQQVHSRFGKCILELGGNNAVVVMPDADMKMAVRSVLFAAVGTAGQRCTSLRRLLLHRDIHDAFLEELVKAYSHVAVGDPLDPKTLCGPLHSQSAFEIYDQTINEVKQQGGNILFGGARLKMEGELQKGFFVSPTLVTIDPSAAIVQQERFVPILHVIKVDDFNHAIKLNNSVKQGLTSAIFTRDMRKVFEWLGPGGSDTGICNVNTSCSGAEIGGAFGGNKETGGGRESGSDSWKQYMRRGTCTINYSDTLPLAQGIEF